MENAADALKIAAAVFIFIVAIAITFSMVAKAKATGDAVLYYSDKTNFYKSYEEKEKEATVSDIVFTLNRIAEGETVTVSIIINGYELVPSDLGTSEEKIGEFIKEILSGQTKAVRNPGVTFDLRKMTFMEQFVEVHYSGMYRSGEDGSQVTVSQGGTREYITYRPL